MELDKTGEKDLLKRARYLGQDQEDDGLSWMDHLEKSQESDPGIPSAIQALAPAVKEEPEHKSDSNIGQQGGKSLQDDIIDPRSMAREQDGPAVRSDVEDLESGDIPITHFKAPEMYGENSSLKYWWDSRERDDNATGTVFGQEYTGLPVEASMKLVTAAFGELVDPDGGIDKLAVSLPQIISENSHKNKGVTIRRAQTITASITSNEDQLSRGLLIFKMQSKGSQETRNTVIQFLKDPNGPGDKSLMEHDCLIGCDCPAFLWWGPMYYANRGNYLFNLAKQEIIGSPEEGKEGLQAVPGATYAGSDPNVAPTKRGPNYTFCKHIYKAYQSASRWSFKIDVKRLSGVKEEIGGQEKEEIRDEFHLDGIGSDSFENFIGKYRPSKDLQDIVDEVMKDHSSDIKKLDDYIVNRWNSAMARGKPEDIRNLVRVMDEWSTAPHIMLYVIQKGREILRANPKYRNFVIPPEIIHKAKEIVQKWANQN